MSSRKNLRLCGRVPIHKEGYIYLFKNGDSPVISGLMRCNSATACVVCSSRIAIARGKWLASVFDSAIDKGYTVSMLTLTVPHKKGDSLETLLAAMEAAYTNVQGTIAYKDARLLYGAYFVRSLEVTHGKNGYHPHFHVAIIHKPGLNWDIYRREIADAWCKNVQRDRVVTKKVRIDGVTHIQRIEITGLRAPNEEIAVHILENATNSQRAEYLTKLSGLSSLEFTNGNSKQACNGNLNIWQIHSLAVQGWEKARKTTPRSHKKAYMTPAEVIEGHKYDRSEENFALDSQTSEYINIWQEYEQAITGKKIISVSRGMAAVFGVPWLSDQSIAEDEFSGESQMPISYNPSILEPELVGAISPNIWKQVVHRKLVRQLRHAVNGGYDELCNFLDEYGIKGRCIPYEYIESRYEVLEVLYHNRDLNEQLGDFESYDILDQEIKVANLYPEIRTHLETMSLINAQNSEATIA
jgi:Replication protein